uniref:Olfactory receptor family 2 subfamily V member 2 n=1 Tax=Rhinopithecus roxellana TaxID=61622 RepID=A0A2K6Q9C4_RHIRO
METWANQLSTNDFILLGIFSHSTADLVLFSVVMVVFTVALGGNILLIFLICMDPQLHTHMYFFLSQLSLMDLMLVCTNVPKMAANFLSDRKSISFVGCGIQIGLFVCLVGSEGLLLGLMAYDRYVAISHPLHYPILMNQKVCLQITGSSWAFGIIDGLIQMVAVMSFPTVAWQKALATCSSHLTAVTLFYGAAMFIYLRPRRYRAPSHDKVASIFYTVLTPMINPLIYSLRNREVMGALRKGLDHCRIGSQP